MSLPQVLPSLSIPFVPAPFALESSPRLLDGEAELWLLKAEGSVAQLAHYHSVLNPEEVARATRFSTAAASRRFVVARGGARLLLGAQLGAPPASLEFILGSHGKPFLGGPHVDQRLHFNVSHSGEWVLIGLARGVEIGVDIESVTHSRPWSAIARRTFGPSELGMLNALSEPFPLPFYQLWSAREAFLKCIGVGLTGWSGRDIAIGSHCAMENSEINRCVGYQLAADDAPGALGAVVLSAPVRTLHCRRY